MALEQQLEQSEELLETNEQNKERVEDARQWVRQAGNQVNAAQAQVRYAQSQLQQAIADRNAAQQRASQEEDGYVPASYDSAVAEAEAELRAANREYQEASRELMEADRELTNAEGSLEESSRALRGVAAELQQVSDKYGIEMGKTRALMSLPHAELASPLLQQLGIGQGRVDDLRQRIAASLGIAMGGTSSGYGGGYGGRGGGRQRAVGGYGGASGYSGGGSAPHIHTPTVSAAPTNSGGTAAVASGGAASTGSGPSTANHGATGTGNGSAGASAAPAGAGWCQSNHFSAVQINSDGEKTVTMTIGGVSSRFPCTKAGIERAYNQAVDAGDADMIARTSAMYEIETLRESLELEEGDADYPQLGGYHKDVKTQDPVGFESHHIPSRSVQDVNAEWLPAISISDADHKLTSSYAGKQRKVYEPILPSSIPSVSYKESITQNLEKGGSGYIDSVKAELLDLRMTTDHRYDGGVSGYLDAVIDMLATRGIPEAKR